MNRMEPARAEPWDDMRSTGRSAIPTATYRLQLHKAFTFGDASARVDYFKALGISHLYLSPIQTARAGSMHGYDVVDHRTINPELGGEAELRSLSEACRNCGMGLIVDIVPNHMAIGGADNAMWLDVLENGEQSAFASVFDIDFTMGDPDSVGKVIVPVLGQPYGDALKEGQLSLVWDDGLGRLAFAYGPHRLPLRPEDYVRVTGGAPPAQADLNAWRDPDALHELLEQQHFRLTWWNAAGDIINWRRFFDVNELAGLRMEDESVFLLTHAIILRLYAEGVVDGVRVDHVDGLADPAAYIRRLRQQLSDRTAQRPDGSPQDGPYIVIEKILGAGEALPADWGMDGTTGYDFMDQVSALQHDTRGEAVLDELWAEISGRNEPYEADEIAARIEVLQGGFAGQLAACAAAFADLAKAGIETRDLTAESFRRGLVAFISHLRGYRTYATGAAGGPSPDAAFSAALATAKEALPADAVSFDFLSTVLAGEGPAPEAGRIAAVTRLNQLTAPVAAKAVEDTAFYRYSRLLSRNDVGFDAGRLSMSSESFLASGQQRAAHWSRAMLTTATHDHKRGEDVRARLAVISELAVPWRDATRYWLSLTAQGRPDAVSPEDAYSLFQTLVGAWPLELTDTDTEGLKRFGERIAGWRQKSLREAKSRSSWAAPDTDYEAANAAWLESLLDPERSAPFLQSVAAFVRRIAPAGAINGVVQAALRCAWPGIPDLYQGAELWDFSLVDPDNRRPVDYDLRERLLNQHSLDWTQGSVKQSVIAMLLRWRRDDPELLTSGRLEPARIRGIRSSHVLAFSRVAGERHARIAVMLHVADPTPTLGALPAAQWWADTEVSFDGAWQSAADLFQDGPVFAAIHSGAEAAAEASPRAA